MVGAAAPAAAATPLGPIIAGVAALDAITGIAGNAATNQANMEVAKYSYDRQQEMWRQSNVYNSPKEQMKRLNEAGLNPNLVYGSGSVAGNTTPASTPQFNAPNLEKRIKPVGMQGLQQYIGMNNSMVQQSAVNSQVQLQSAQVLKTLAETVSEKMRPQVMGAEILNMDARTQNQLFETSRAKAFMPYQQTALDLSNQQVRQKISNMITENKLNKQQIKNLAQGLLNAKEDFNLKKLTQLEKQGHIEDIQKGYNLPGLGIPGIAKYIEKSLENRPEWLKW